MSREWGRLGSIDLALLRIHAIVGRVGCRRDQALIQVCLLGVLAAPAPAQRQDQDQAADAQDHHQHRQQDRQHVEAADHACRSPAMRILTV
jgi:hypothetical protein